VSTGNFKPVLVQEKQQIWYGPVLASLRSRRVKYDIFVFIKESPYSTQSENGGLSLFSGMTLSTTSNNEQPTPKTAYQELAEAGLNLDYKQIPTQGSYIFLHNSLHVYTLSALYP